MIQEDVIRIYSNPYTGRREKYPFEGWRYYTEYIHTEDGISCASGVNRGDSDGIPNQGASNHVDT